MSLKRFLYFYSAYLILSAAVARKGLTWLRETIGAAGVDGLSWVLLGVTLVLILFLAHRYRIPLTRLAVIGLTFGGIFFFLKEMHQPEERIHIFQYGLLGFLLVVSRRGKSWPQALGTALFIVLLVTCADELFQAFLPDRVGDLRDVGFGCLGGGWGAVVALLTVKNHLPETRGKTGD